MIDLSKVLGAIQMAGSALPAFGTLLGHVKELFSPADQETIQNAYEAAKLRSDAMHNDLQDALSTMICSMR